MLAMPALTIIVTTRGACVRLSFAVGYCVRCNATVTPFDNVGVGSGAEQQAAGAFRDARLPGLVAFLNSTITPLCGIALEAHRGHGDDPDG
jgi:hypothetical protein